MGAPKDKLCQLAPQPISINDQITEETQTKDVFTDLLLNIQTRTSEAGLDNKTPTDGQYEVIVITTIKVFDYPI